ncbi:hypothetical protein SAMN04488029_4071 [Reichenbachiella faecimaris]|uniref:Uncharacterized protein n=1 Tax=Reichenbachiella faecimaris TaxID=692418 RepID=A0A1W2GRG5_REIFA|nr:DUF6768 family protein [Reichenbachiella faecimaris]SMD39154.1 hypothetical protein SAMN04488029_4071 [Reichenbachiella faecimaris]
MKNQNEEIDEMIKTALSNEEAAFYEDLKEQSPFEMIGGLFEGKMKWWTIGNVFISLVFIALSVVCLLKVIEVENTNALIRWSLGLIGSMLIPSMLKLWNWNQMQRNAILREIKRLQLLVAHKE